MAFNEQLAERIRHIVGDGPGLTERKMFGGMAFMLNGNMFCGITRDDLMLRVGPDRFEEALARPGARPMDFTGRPMKGMAFVGPQGYETDEQLRGWVEQTLEGRFKLTLNREKTRVVKMHQPGASLDFLGFTFRYERDLFGRNRRYLRVEPSKKAERRFREKVREQTGPQWNWMPLPTLIGRLDQTLRGWCAYFRHGHPHRVFYRLDGYVLMRLWRHLRRRSQRRYRPPAHEPLYAHLRRFGLQFPTDLKGPAHA